ncbi:LysE family translocator [Nitratidesulfovibrio liaohensis]|uniref:LysE family translocator n=1 Tax=Nitratidesulfovibrio liaohensis TaxID=2604158 RepID=UPI001421E939|nr:LysE family translocator [Nitratidesulfovibrio liaohensis]NHZ47858.1 LysE family translocator [Nitratidesulfovibrio liaohensis]
MSLLSLLLYCVVVTFTPGPTNIVILSIAQGEGTRRALVFSAGAAAAFALMLAASAALNSLLAELLPPAQPVLQLVGGAYMLYLAWKVYGMDVGQDVDQDMGDAPAGATGDGAAPDALAVHGAATRSDQALFVTGFLMQFVNPKVVMFTLTVMPSFVALAQGSRGGVAAGVAAVSVIGWAAFAAWVGFGALLRRFLSAYRRVVNVLMALFLVYCAVAMSGVQQVLAH